METKTVQIQTVAPQNFNRRENPTQAPSGEKIAEKTGGDPVTEPKIEAEKKAGETRRDDQDSEIANPDEPAC